jgi:RNA polymerase sigma-70 factor (ECF subfamily)
VSSITATPETVALVRAARAGDRDAFGALYRLYGAMVHGVCLARVPSADAPDLVQEVFILALRRLSQLRDDAAFGGWLAALARHAAADFHRSPARRGPTAELPAHLAATERADGGAEYVLEAIRGLPEAYRETLMLRLVEGMTGPEIALRTGLRPDSVRVNLHRGMKLLRATLQGSLS